MSFFGPDALSLAAWRTLTAPDGNSNSDSNKRGQVVMQRSGGSHFSETTEGIQLSVDIPGVKAKELLVKVDKGILTISGSRKIILEGGGRKKFRFEKNFTIDVDSIDVPSITANLCNGVLILKANKQTPKGPHVVQVTEHDVPEQEEEEDEEEEEEEDSKKSPEVLTVNEDDDEKGKKK